MLGSLVSSAQFDSWIGRGGQVAHPSKQENTMPQSTHDRIAELHNLAAHAHSAAATAHGKGDHLTAHELSKHAHEHSKNAFRHSEEAVAEAPKPGKT